MAWFEIQLTAAQVRAGELGRVRDHFQIFFTQVGRPADVAMFSAQDAGSEEVVRLYFSPATEEHANAFLRTERARRCERPGVAIALAAGHGEALSRFRAGRF